MPKFRLNEFKAVARWLDRKLPGPLAFFLKGWLWGLEERYIDAKVVAAVDKGIAPHLPPEPTVAPPSYHSEPSEVEGLDTIELKAPWTTKN
ncbi:MAG: hypothetical protein HOL29_08755 [Euryarchaeota archaeon]|jgi:hypothetical protein|nr:hypothetical protein [Euryarchaeota archaeon]